MAIFNKDNNLVGKAKNAASKAMSVSDEKLADIIVKAANKQKRINDILHQKGSDYHINSLDVEVGLPPKIVFGITTVTSTSFLEDDSE